MNPTGWVTAWGNSHNDASAAKKTVVGQNGLVTLPTIEDGFKPWYGLTAKDDFTLVTYGCADMVSVPSEELATLWCMGGKDGNKIALIKDSDGHIKLVQADGRGAVSQEIDAGIVKGYHLFTVQFSETEGASLQIDGGKPLVNASFTTKPSDGFQVGSIYQGLTSGFADALGFIVCQMVGYDSATLPTERYYAQLCAKYPAVTTMSGFAAEDKDELYIPSLSLVTGELSVAQRTVVIADVSIENGATLDLTDATVESTGAASSIKVDVGTLRVQAGQELPCSIVVSANGVLDIVGGDIVGGVGKVTILDVPGLELEEGATLRFDGAELPDYYTASVADGVLSVELTGEVPVAEEAVLRISEIMPKGGEKNADPNGLESGWVEVVNTSTDKWADLADYRFIRINRCKEVKEKGFGNFPTCLIPPGGRFVFYTSEMYPNGKGWVEDDEKVGLFGTKDMDKKGKPIAKYYQAGELGITQSLMVWPDKVNPKKHPFVRLYYAPGGDIASIVDTVVVPSDLPEDASIVVEDAGEGESTVRWYDTNPTPGAANHARIEAQRLGPNVGPMYEFEWNDDYKKKYVESEFQFKNFTKPATAGEAYTVTLPINPVMAPTATANENDAITSVKLIYRKGFGTDETMTTGNADMTVSGTGDYNWGTLYTATIPADFITDADKGHLIQWKVEITDASEKVWTSPSFNNKDDGYEWYGTIVDPGTYEGDGTEENAIKNCMNSKLLPTWHMFADRASLSQMDKDNPEQDKTITPYCARVAIYDWDSQTYYDYVRIDLRGNTSKHFAKKSHGLRFAKAHPMLMVDSVTGEEMETEVRKSSLISEYADPSWMRQMVAFWLFNKMGNKVPFDFPVRCNLNGAFYQLAFHSERFSDELMEDFYGLDKFGHGYKNVGTLRSDSSTSAGSIEKKLPDDGDESDVSVLEDHLRAPLKQFGAERANEKEVPELTAFVVEKFDLPAWLNYIASSKITHETDDVWANISAYYDHPMMKDGSTRGTGTWMPLAYDFNLSFGQYYYNNATEHPETRLMAEEDWFKSHPFYGGNRVRCYQSSADDAGTVESGNSAYEAIFQSEKFRRLYLRRLRTLMDQELKAAGDETTVPFMVKMRELADKMRVDSKLDQAKWPNNDSDDAIDVWRSEEARPADIDAGIQEIWDNYVVPRRVHLYETHSVNNTEKGVGYGAALSAGIPEAQSAIANLAAGLSASYDATIGAVIIKNTNAETIDLSNWELTGPVEMTLPPGTVIDQVIDGVAGEVYVTADRRATVAAMSLDDQVVVGNGTAGSGIITLTAADGTEVFAQPPYIPTESGETAQDVVNAATSATGIPVVGVAVTADTLKEMIQGTEDGATTITVGGATGVTVTVPKYYSVGALADGTGFSLTLNDVAKPMIGDAKVTEDETTEDSPAFFFDDAGNVVITVTTAYPKLIYTLWASDEPAGPFVEVEGATATDKDAAFRLKAAKGNATKKFYKIVVEDTK